MTNVSCHALPLCLINRLSRSLRMNESVPGICQNLNLHPMLQAVSREKGTAHGRRKLQRLG